MGLERLGFPAHRMYGAHHFAQPGVPYYSRVLTVSFVNTDWDLHMDNHDTETSKLNTREEVSAFLADIGRQLLDNNLPTIHTLLALNQILRLRNAEELFDEELKEQARDIWLKVKATGVHLIDPPLLFGHPPLTDGEDAGMGDDDDGESPNLAS